MAINACVCTTYKVEYGRPRLAGHQEFINTLLSENCPSFSWDGSDVAFSMHVEVSRDDLQQLVDELSKRKHDCLEIEGMDRYAVSASEVLQAFKEWLLTADADNDFVAIDWV